MVEIFILRRFSVLLRANYYYYATAYFFTSNPLHNSIILRRSFRRPCLCVSFKLVKDNLLVIMMFPHMYVVGKKRAAERPCRQRHCMYSTVLYSTYVNSYI